MFFALLVLISAFFIEGIGTYVSVVGLSALFSANPVIIALAISLDVGKVISVSFLYKYWKQINFIMKSYMTIACMILMIITSTGAFGFLSGEFQHAISNTNQNNVIISSLKEEQSRLQKRKEDIDKQISQLPSTSVRGRTQLIRQFGPEVRKINDRLEAIDKELPKLKVESLKKNVEVGPIIYIAEAFNTTPEQAVKWVILIIIFVFDPLAVALLLAGNFLIELRNKKETTPENKDAHNVKLPTDSEFNDNTEKVKEIEDVIKNQDIVKQQFKTDDITSIIDTLQDPNLAEYKKDDIIFPKSEIKLEKFVPDLTINSTPDPLINLSTNQEAPINSKNVVDDTKKIEQTINTVLHKSSLEDPKIGMGDVDVQSNERQSSQLKVIQNKYRE